MESRSRTVLYLYGKPDVRVAWPVSRTHVHNLAHRIDIFFPYPVSYRFDREHVYSVVSRCAMFEIVFDIPYT